MGKTDVGTLFKDSLVFDDGDLHKNLISLPKLDDSGHKILIENGQMKIYKHNTLVLEGRKESGLYMIDLDNEKLVSALADSKPGAYPMDVAEAEIKAPPLCDACQRAKFTKLRRRGRRMKRVVSWFSYDHGYERPYPYTWIERPAFLSRFSGWVYQASYT